MKIEIINTLTSNFESFANKTKGGVEFWFARDLQKLLGYSKWENFREVLEKAKISCDTANVSRQEHFPDIRKSSTMPNGGVREIEDIMLSRYACYLVAQNGDQKVLP